MPYSSYLSSLSFGLGVHLRRWVGDKEEPQTTLPCICLAHLIHLSHVFIILYNDWLWKKFPLRFFCNSKFVHAEYQGILRKECGIPSPLGESEDVYSDARFFQDHVDLKVQAQSMHTHQMKIKRAVLIRLAALKDVNPSVDHLIKPLSVNVMLWWCCKIPIMIQG